MAAWNYIAERGLYVLLALITIAPSPSLTHSFLFVHADPLRSVNHTATTLVLLIGWCSTEDEVLYKRFVVEAQGPQGPLFGPFRGQKEAYVG